MDNNGLKSLLVISNHNPDKWSEEQRAGWDTIDYIPFPNLSPEMSIDDLDWTDKMFGLVTDIRRWMNRHIRAYINIQGEYAMTVMVTQIIHKEYGWVFTYPTTDRMVEEKDGVKTSKFKFVRWR